MKRIAITLLVFALLAFPLLVWAQGFCGDLACNSGEDRSNCQPDCEKRGSEGTFQSDFVVPSSSPYLQPSSSRVGSVPQAQTPPPREFAPLAVAGAAAIFLLLLAGYGLATSKPASRN